MTTMTTPHVIVQRIGLASSSVVVVPEMNKERSILSGRRGWWCTRQLQAGQQRFCSSYPSHDVVGLPALSPTMTSGTLSAWKVQPGSVVSPGDILADIETDKAVVEFEAQDDMIIAQLLVPEGTSDLPVGAPILITVEEKEDVPAFASYTTPTLTSTEEEKMNDGTMEAVVEEKKGTESIFVQRGAQGNQSAPAPQVVVSTPSSVATENTTMPSSLLPMLERKRTEYHLRYGSTGIM